MYLSLVQPHGLQPARLLLSIGFPRQEYWSGLPFPSPGDPPDPEIEPTSPAWQTDSSLYDLPIPPVSLYSREIKRDIPGGPVVKNQPANTRGRDLICGPGTFHARPLKPGSLALQQEPWQQKSVHCK